MIERDAAIATAGRGKLTMLMRTNSPPRYLVVIGAIIFALPPGLASAASVVRSIVGRAAPAGVESTPVMAAGSLVLAHLDEESVPPAENPANSATGATASAPDVNPGPSADWERLPADLSAIPSANPAQAANPPAPIVNAPSGAGSAASAMGADAAHSDKSNATGVAPTIAPAVTGAATANAAVKSPADAALQSSAPIAPAASVQNTPAADANSSAASALQSASGENANPEPPPALDLGSIQNGPDLAELSLGSEIKNADTPARAAALRVTEQARIELAGGRTDDAIRNLGRAVSIDPGNPFEYFYLGRAYIARRNYEQALTFLKRAEIGFGGRADWLGETVGFEGACYEELGKLAGAALAYRRALALAPNNLTARVGYTRLASYLPSPAGLDAPAAPAREPSAPPERDAAAPAPEEAPPPPPPAPLPPESAPKKIQPIVGQPG